MCQAFSCIVTKEGSVYWKAGVDSHENIIDLFKAKDKLLIDNKLPADFVRIDVVPENNDYLNKDGKWIFELDDKEPKWWNKNYRDLCYTEFKKWKKEIYSSFNYIKAKNPIHPFKIEPPEIIQEIIELLKIWASIRASVGVSIRASVGVSVWDSVWDLIGDSVGASVWVSVGASVGVLVRDSVRALVGVSVWASVWNSIGASVGAYIGSLFPKIKKWEYINYKKEPFKSMEGYPFQSSVDLWKMGLIPSFDGKMWRLHSKNGIAWEDKKHEIR